MYKIKQIPEDFIVKEMNNLELDDNGIYSYFSLKKKNYNTLRAIKIISEKLKIPEKNIGFAGNKDKNAVTEQFISIKNGNKNIEIKDIELKFLGKGNKEVFLGSHKGNEFIITIRNLDNNKIKSIEKRINESKILMPNYFGPQRFSNSNNLIGENIVKKDFKKAIELIINTNSDYNEKIKQHLEKQKNDYIGALKTIPSKLLKLYIHSYQSLLFNNILEQSINNKNIEKNTIEIIPLIGFGTEIENNETKIIVDKILEKENIGFRDFIIKQIPELSVEGDERKAFIKISDFKIIKQEKDELNKNKEKLIIKFSLPKGCYATVLIDFLFKN